MVPNQSGVQRYVFAGLNDAKTMSVTNTGKVTLGTDKYDLSSYRLFVKDGIKTKAYTLKLLLSISEHIHILCSVRLNLLMLNLLDFV